MNEIKEAVIPYYAHEGEMVRMERMNKRLWIVIIILIVALIGTNVAWLVYESQFTDEVITVEQEGQTENGGDNIFNGTGELTIYGESEANSNNQAQSP